jgi:hypothetical protein
MPRITGTRKGESFVNIIPKLTAIADIAAVLGGCQPPPSPCVLGHYDSARLGPVVVVEKSATGKAADCAPSGMEPTTITVYKKKT